MSSCSTFSQADPPLHLALDRAFDSAGTLNSESDLPDVLRRDTEPPGNCAVHAVEKSGIGNLRPNPLRVVTLVQVTTPEYESDHTTTFISGQEVCSVPKKDKDLALIAERIRRVRHDLKLTQEGFAEKLGVDQTTVSKWEGGKARPTPEALLAVASVADGIDQLFFIERAGLPEQYMMGTPMIPEILEASDRVVKSVMYAKRGAAKPFPDREIRWDQGLMTFVIEAIDSELKKRRRKLPIRKYAKMVVLIYEFCEQTGRRDSEAVQRFLQVA
jgi:transcriptional regulator with XRE-family HTH domain